MGGAGVLCRRLWAGLVLLDSEAVNRKRVTIAVAATWGLMWLLIGVVPNAIHYWRVWKADGEWCAARAENGAIVARWYGEHCDPEWARQQPGD